MLGASCATADKVAERWPGAIPAAPLHKEVIDTLARATESAAIMKKKVFSVQSSSDSVRVPRCQIYNVFNKDLPGV